MDSDLYRSTLLAQTRAALKALLAEDVERPAWTAEGLSLLLERWGDLLRLGEGLPQKSVAFTTDLDAELLASVVALRCDEAAQWTLPDAGPVSHPGELGFTLTRRDETESLLAGLTRLTMARRPALPVADLAGSEALFDVLEAFDAALAQRVTRLVAEAALEMRVALHGEGSWLDALREEEGATEDAEPGPGMDELLQEGSRPSDGVTDRYIHKGLMRKYVEGWAACDAAYADDLAFTIDALRDCDEVISLMAASWRKRRATTSDPAPVRVRFEGVVQQAAATKAEAGEPKMTTVELGPIPGVDAEAEVTYADGTLTLRVYPEDTLTQCELNGVAGHPEGEDCWAVTLENLGEVTTLHVLVVDGRGQRFEDDIQLELT